MQKVRKVLFLAYLSHAGVINQHMQISKVRNHIFHHPGGLFPIHEIGDIALGLDSHIRKLPRPIENPICGSDQSDSAAQTA